ncbi:hypothetical protein N9C62_02875 [Luminiphilus sp.]|nr:hypothetical protein [Luminiphilus sp.]
MHQYFEYIIAEIADKKGTENQAVLDSLKSTVEHAARKHLHLNNEADIRAEVDSVTGEISVTIDGKSVPMSDLGNIHRTDFNLNA